MIVSMPRPEYEKWLEGPPPTSKFQKIKARVKFFDVKNLTERGLNGQYPCQLIHPMYPQLVWFWELQGHGPPPDDILVYPGDIYIDLAALPVVDIYQRNASNTWKQWNPTETPKTTNILPHPYIPDRCLATTKARCIGYKAELSYLAIATIIRRGSTSEPDAIFQCDLTEMFPRKLDSEMNHGAAAVEVRSTDGQSSNNRIRIADWEKDALPGSTVVLPSTTKKSTVQEHVNSACPANHCQEKQLRDSLARVSELEKKLCDERNSSRSLIDELRTSLAQERTAFNKTVNQLENLNKNLKAKYEMVLHRLGDEQAMAVGVKRKLHEIHEICNFEP